MSDVVSSAPRRPTVLHFPAFSFRDLPAPFNEDGVEVKYAYVPIGELPLVFAQWEEVNPREGTTRGAVPRAIRQSLQEQPEYFGLLNRGLTILAKKVSWDNAERMITAEFDDHDLHGVGDGVHTLMNVFDVVQGLKADGATTPAHIKIEFVVGDLTRELVSNFSRARNTSNQVRPASLADQQHLFEPMKQAVSSSGIDPAIFAWHENDDGEREARDLVGLLSTWNKARFDDSTHPVQSYSGKAQTLQYFIDHPDEFEPLYPLVGDVLRVEEDIKYHVPLQQLAARSNFGNITGIRKAEGAPLPFTGRATNYDIPDAYVLPIVASMRALLAFDGTTYRWGSVDPRTAIQDGLASKEFRDVVYDAIDQHHSALVVGRKRDVWHGCYNEAKLYYLERRV